MPRIVLVLLALLAVLFIGSELLIPGLAARRVEERLERDGGEARVELRAFPAVRLLFSRGRELEIEGGGMTLDLDQGQAGGGVLERVEGFDDVRVRLSDLRAGPLQISSFELDRQDGESRFHLRISGRALPRELAAFVGSRAVGPLGAVLGGLAAGALPGEGTTRVPVQISGAVESRDDGTLEVIEGASASVAGIPLGPMAALVVGSVARRL